MVAAIGEQILAPTDVSLSNWTVRPSSGCSVVHTAGAVSVDGYTLTLAVNPWNIVRTYNLTPGRELLFACRYRLGTASNFVVYMSEADNVYDPLYGSFVGDQGAWSAPRRRACPTRWNGGRLRPPDPGRNPGDRQRGGGGGGHSGLGAAAEARVPEGPTTSRWPPWARCCWSPRSPRWQFSGALQQPELCGLSQLHGGRLPAGGLRHDPERLRLEPLCAPHAGRGDATPSAAGTGWARPPTW